ncbi:unnamed protein product [Prunus brigantina]
MMDFFSQLKRTLLEPVNDVAVCCNVFKMRTAEEQLRLIEKCLRSFVSLLLELEGPWFLHMISPIAFIILKLVAVVYVVWKIRNGMNNKLVHAEIPDEPHVPFDRAVQIAGGFREAA